MHIHKWSKWELNGTDYIEVNQRTGREVDIVVQLRTCAKCGRIQIERL